MKMRIQICLTSLILVCFLAPLALLVFWANSRMLQIPELTQEIAQRIQRGMCEEKVNEIVGAPPGDYRTKPLLLADEWKRELVLAFVRSSDQKHWISDAGILTVVFDVEGLVFFSLFTESVRTER